MNFQKLKKTPFLRVIFAPYIFIKRFFIHRSYRKFYERYDEMMKLVRSESLEIELKEFGGVFSVGKESLLAKFILKEGEYEPDIVALVKQHLDTERDVLDIGANVGFFSVLCGDALANGSRVLAAEPTPGALKRLKLNLEQNGVKNVILHEGLVGKENGLVPFNVVEGKEEYSSMKPIAHEHAVDFESKPMDILCRRIDDLVLEHELNPGFMKIDVEGAEWDVMQGATKTIEKFRPVILTELDDRLLQGFDATVKTVCEFLESYEYVVKDADGLGRVRAGLTNSVLAIPKKN